MYKSILVPIDVIHENVGIRIVEKAKVLSDKGAKMTLLHVMDDIPSNMHAYIPEGKLESNLLEIKSELSTMAKKIGVDAEIVVRFGIARSVILEEAESMEADLIILASHKPGLQDYLIGSTASRIVRHARCSVLIDRQEVQRIIF